MPEVSLFIWTKRKNKCGTFDSSTLFLMETAYVLIHFFTNKLSRLEYSHGHDNAHTCQSVKNDSIIISAILLHALVSLYLYNKCRFCLLGLFHLLFCRFSNKSALLLTI